MRSRSARLRAETEWQRAELAGLRQRLEELERRLGLHSGHSGQPPSSDGPAQPPAERRTRSPGTGARSCARPPTRTTARPTARRAAAGAARR